MSGGAAAGAAETPAVSLVVPVYRGAIRLERLAARAIPVLDALGGELVLVDDGSDDGTWSLMTRLAAPAGGTTAVRLGRRAGQQTATLAGCAYARGRWIVTMDDDLEHPPEAVPLLLDRAARGCNLVYGVPAVRRYEGFRRYGSLLFDRAFTHLIGKPAGLRLTSFRVMGRSLVDCMLRQKVRVVYVSALAFACGPRAAAVPVALGPRVSSRYSSLALARVFLRTIAQYSRPGRVLIRSGQPVRASLPVGEVVRRAG